MDHRVDETGWPIVRVRWSGALEDAVLDDFLARMAGWLARRERFGVLIDARGGDGLTPRQRRLVVESMQRNQDEAARWLVQAIVHDSAVLRALDIALTVLVPRSFPSHTFGDVESAEAWIKKQLAR